MERGVFSFFFGKPKKLNKAQKTPFTILSAKAKTLPEDVSKCNQDFIYSVENKKCIGRHTVAGKAMAMHRWEKYHNVPFKGDALHGLFQFEDNCWFNALLMCLFFSDGTRDILEKQRLHWIQGCTNSAKSRVLNIFTYLMEIPHYDSGSIVNTVDSNIILSILHKYKKSIFNHPGYEAGSGILYCKNLLSFLGIENYIELRFIQIPDKKWIYYEKNGKFQSYLQDVGDIYDIVSVLKTHEIAAIYIDVPQFVFPNKIDSMTLSSMYVSNHKKDITEEGHAIAGITCSKATLLYDGVRAQKGKLLKPFDWKSTKANTSFVMSYESANKLKYNFSKSSRIGFYSKIIS